MPNYGYSNHEYMEMVDCYKDSGEILSGAQRLYEKRNGRRPCLRTIFGAVQRQREHGRFDPPAVDTGRPRYPAWIEDEVIDFVNRNPTASLREAATASGGVSHTYVRRLLRREKCNMRRRRTISSDSDEVPLDIYKTHDPYKTIKREKIACEFCDKVFTSRFASFEHNASHITIPLVQLSLHQCEECLRHFTSLDELTSHAIAENHVTSQTVPARSEYDIILQSIVSKQVVVKCHDLFDDVKQIDVNNEVKVLSEVPVSSVDANEGVSCINDTESNGWGIPVLASGSLKNEHVLSSVNSIEKPDHNQEREETNDCVDTIPKIEPELIEAEHSSHKWEQHSDSDTDHIDNEDVHIETKFYHSDEEIREVDQSIFHYTSVDTKPIFNSSPEYEPTRSRLMFEEDPDDLAEEILPDKHYTNSIGNVRSNTIILGSHGVKNGVNQIANGNSDTSVNGIVGEYTESVHNDTLLQPEICECRYCGRCFSNRMGLICHESTHLRIRRPRPVLCPLCENYFAGNYTTVIRHMKAAHPQYNPEEGRKLQLKKCETCKLRYHNYVRHVRYYHEYQPRLPMQSPIILLCDDCNNIHSNNSKIKSRNLGPFKDAAKSQECQRCQKSYSRINVVVSYSRNKIKSTNRDRLQRIQQRLKMIKKINKCFCCCFICR